MYSALNLQNQDFAKNDENNLSKIKHYSYSLKDQLSYSYQCCVYKGINNVTSEIVAIKVIQLKRLKTQLQKTLLQGQKKVVGLLMNQNISGVCKYHQIIETKTHVYIVMQYEEGGNLQQVLDKDRLSEAEVKKLLFQIIAAYIKLCQLKIVHRDIKPANILIDKEGNYKISDFGYSIIQSQEAKKYNYCLGSPAFSSPQSLQFFTYGIKSDIWALGVIAWKALTAKVPWKGRNNKQLLQVIKNNPISQNLQNIHESLLIKFIKNCCNPQIDERFGLDELKSYETELFNDMKHSNQITDQCQLKSKTQDQQNKSKSSITKKSTEIPKSKNKTSPCKNQENQHSQAIKFLKQNKSQNSMFGAQLFSAS